MGEMRTINFYRAGDSYGVFSNFSKHPIELDGKIWPTTEHYFQAKKFLDENVQELIRRSKTAGDAARLGRSRSLPLREDWEDVKDQIMYDAVWAKFNQHEEARTTLLNTDDARLVEHTERDSYWGDGGDGSGKNMLGRVLMWVRCRLVIDETIAATCTNLLFK